MGVRSVLVWSWNLGGKASGLGFREFRTTLQTPHDIGGVISDSAFLLLLSVYGLRSKSSIRGMNPLDLAGTRNCESQRTPYQTRRPSKSYPRIPPVLCTNPRAADQSRRGARQTSPALPAMEHVKSYEEPLAFMVAGLAVL